MPQESLITIATRHQSHYERLKASEVKKFDEFLIKMDQDLREILTRGEISDFTRDRVEAQIKQVGIMMAGTFEQYKIVWRDSVLSSAIYEADFEARALGQVVDGVEFTLPADSQITAAVFSAPLGDIGGAAGGALLTEYFDGMSQAQINKVQGAIRLGYAEGQTTAQIVQRIRGTKSAGYSDGIWSTTKRDVETVVRTALQHASSQARNQVWQDNESVIKGVQWVSTLDSRTSPQCRALDGQVYPINKGPRPPAHQNCRSTTIAVLNKKYADLSKGRTRSARDLDTGKVEQVSGKETYYSWLKKQPAAVQDSIIGPSRGALLRNGGISAERFAELQLGKNFEPLTLEEMRKLDPIAFDKAGL